ncbi:MAG: hypothetical protein A2Z73_00510 [Deltaproteobacteria bacterium RBG_13_60_28]|nr:MAG: hypothetical protein A2Z73_00510 [Deltaproteobacteria bacterium RBG_13_60_28]
MGIFAKTGGKELKVEFGRYVKGKSIVVKHIETALINSINLLSYIRIEYEDIMKRVIDVCHDLNDKGELKKQIQPTQKKGV